ncbi:MAG: IS66 family transposase [Clostridiales bacterium]|nr:IS66 family transposase [Clostridiales bacterium]
MPSLVATIITGKYLNHLPLDRQSKYYKNNCVKLEPNTMANWIMNVADLYLSTIFNELQKHLYSFPDI